MVSSISRSRPVAEATLSWLRSRHRRLGACLAFVGSALNVAPASAVVEPTLQVTVRGDCPSRDVLDRALTQHALAQGHGSLMLAVESSAGRATLLLTDPSGARLLERTLESDDCLALAEALAVIVDAYFVEIDAQSTANQQAKSAPLPVFSASPGTPFDHQAKQPDGLGGFGGLGGSKVASGREGSPGPGGLGGVDPVGEPDGGARLNGTAESASRQDGMDDHASGRSPAVADGTSPRAQREHRLGQELYFHAGVEMLPSLGLATAAFGGGIAVDWQRPRMFAGLDLRTTAPKTHDIPDRVWRWASRATLRWGIGVGSSPEIRPWGGAGLSRVQVRAPDLATRNDQTVWSFVAEAGIGILQPVGRGWALAGDFGCYVLGSQEIYRIDPDGVLGRGPREGCSLLAGVMWLTMPAQP